MEVNNINMSIFKPSFPVYRKDWFYHNDNNIPANFITYRYDVTDFSTGEVITEEVCCRNIDIFIDLVLVWCDSQLGEYYSYSNLRKITNDTR